MCFGIGSARCARLDDAFKRDNMPEKSGQPRTRSTVFSPGTILMTQGVKRSKA
jgi:hypothetical protein